MTVRFASPLFPWLPAATLLVLAIVFAVDLTRRRRLLERVGEAAQLSRMMASVSPRGRVVKSVLVVVAATLIALAVSRPEIEGESTWRKRGVDVVLTMDYSKSMLARDVYPSRLESMVKEVDDLLGLLDSDRVAVVTFAGAAAHFPLTHDYEAARNLYAGLRPQDMPAGSNLGEALMVARCIVRPDLVEDPGCARIGGRGRGGAPLVDREQPRPEPAPDPGDRSRVILLFTDGEATDERARTEVEQAVLLGIQVYVVGVGTVAGELIPEVDDDGEHRGWKKNDDGTFVTTRLDRAGLKELARVAGGESHYFERVAAKDIADLLRRLKKGDLDARVEREWKSAYQWLLFPALLLLAIEACVSGRRRGVLYPEEQT